MNKFVLMVVLTFCGCSGALIRGPFVPMAVYYFYAVLRPQFLWRWQLTMFPEFGWSFYVAGAALLSYLPWALGIVGPRNDPERRVFLPFILPHKFLVLFALWNCLSYGYANNQGVAYPYFEELLKIFVMYLLATQVVRSLWQVRVLYLIATLSIGYIAVDINQLYFETGYLLLIKQGFAGLDNNGAALMLAMGIPLSYFAWEFTRGWYRWGFLIFIPLILHAVVSSYSRGAMVSALIVSPLYLVYTRKRRFLMLCYLGVAFLVPFLAGAEIQDRFFTATEAEADGSFQSRLDSWDAARKIANDFPFFGAGIRNSNLLSKQYGADEEGRTIHNNYLQIAADCGWVGLLWYLLLIGTVVVSAWRARARLWKYKDDPESVRTVAMLGGLECCIWTFLIGSTALSMETVELVYLIYFLCAQVWAIVNAKLLPPPGVQIVPTPRNQILVPKTRPNRNPIDPSASGPIYSSGPGTLPERSRPSGP